MKRLSINYLLNEDSLTLLLSIVLWVISLLVFFFFAQLLFSEEKIKTSGDDIRVNRYSEQISVSAVIH